MFILMWHFHSAGFFKVLEYARGCCNKTPLCSMSTESVFTHEMHYFVLCCYNEGGHKYIYIYILPFVGWKLHREKPEVFVE